MQAGITKIKYNNAGQLDHNASRFEIGIDLKLVYNNNIIQFEIKILYINFDILNFYIKVI